MLVTHTFDLALAARGRRKQLKLRQAEVAQAAQVGREWLVDFEHGKPTLELAKVLRTLTTLGVQVHVEMARTPDWTLPLTAQAIDRRARVAALRPKTRVLKDRADVTPPADWPGRGEW
jgi:HTH-type transcriptional regulator/antitoxin HipB